ncbi:SDR family NAD(P)-dependent oxidoreductase [Colwellia sp. UCD-KL20]|uniref:SDR family NAD(P)-dependent oxidoreductase n=1 Tax=Colwellia sp. UCD-KL20 TaxID=1917165 RepID=UPI0009703633|nr:SDR family NAD(P)-dependent oxidoreductase [Colwellia sp. UCD-KL20]
MQNQTIVIIGANSEIAKALTLEIISNSKNDDNTQLIVISRNVEFYRQEHFHQLPSACVNSIAVTAYSEDEISHAVKKIDLIARFEITKVFVCHGVLHDQQCQPEKRLEDFSPEAFTRILTANTITPMLWLKHLTPVLSGSHDCNIVVFTARVGSISDNKLGGWYSYRASKAAMNMLLTSAAVELARRAKNIKLISFHPGTTDSPLSKPFQKNVPEGKLFTSEFVAKKLLMIVENTAIDGKASYLDWQGKNIPW